MVSFQTKILKKEKRIGDQLAEARQKRDLTLKEAARSLGLAAKYLLALEDNRFSALPGEIYTKNFIKKYAELLNLKPLPLLMQYVEEKKSRALRKQIKDNRFSSRLARLWSWPRLFRRALALTIVVILISYLIMEVKGILQAPKLILESPTEGFISPRPFLAVKGLTAPEIKLNINGEEIFSDKRGGFEENVDLHDGLNVITIIALKKHNRSATAIRNVIYYSSENISTNK